MSDELETLHAECERLRKQNAAMREALTQCAIAPLSETARRLRDAALAPDAASTLPSVAGHMEMTHQDFQRACQVELGRLERDPNCDNALVRLLCEAVRCSRECCELAKTGLQIPSTLLMREQVKPLVDMLQELALKAGRFPSCYSSPGEASEAICSLERDIHEALAIARTLGFK